MSAAVDPAIMGGLVTQIGSTVWDGSVKRQLEKMREKLAAGSRQKSVDRSRSEARCAADRFCF